MYISVKPLFMAMGILIGMALIFIKEMLSYEKEKAERKAVDAYMGIFDPDDPHNEYYAHLAKTDPSIPLRAEASYIGLSRVTKMPPVEEFRQKNFRGHKRGRPPKNE